MALSAARQRRPIVLVLGMHRSGTSLCSHVLSTLGVDMTDQIPAPGAETLLPDNAKGHWERWEIVDFHDRILGLFDRAYYSPSHDLRLPVAWWADPRVAETRREIVGFLERRMGADLFGFKDPRTVRLMPMWHQIIKELKLTPKIIYCLRNPAQVARSLHAREGMRLELGEYRWFTYNVDFFQYARGSEICTIEYESWFDDYRINLTRLRKFLELPEDQSEFEVDLAVSEIVDNALRHDDQRLGDANQPLIRSVYKLAQRAELDPAAREPLQNIASQFLSFQQLQATVRDSIELPAAVQDPVDNAAVVSDDGTFPRCVSFASFWQPEHIVQTGWRQHAPFAFWITEALQPGIFVELGTHHGFSYLVFCQAVQRLGIGTKCYAVDSWKGDEHSGFYDEAVFAKLNDLHERLYLGFSRLVRSTFDEARAHFGDGTIDLLHIDGRHGYDDVAHDFESWLPKLSDRAVVLLHDINVRERGFGVWQFWSELQVRYPCFEFMHGHGLGVAQVGKVVSEALKPLLDSRPEVKSAIAEIYAQLGRQSAQQEVLAELESQKAANDELAAQVVEMREALAEAQARQDLEPLRDQLNALRDAVAQAEREARERHAAEAAMRSDIAKALQLAQRQSEEVGVLKSELARARQVGRSALQALAAGSLATPYREPRLGWRQRIRHLLGAPRPR